jgi:hypothetical protein
VAPAHATSSAPSQSIISVNSSGGSGGGASRANLRASADEDVDDLPQSHSLRLLAEHDASLLGAGTPQVRSRALCVLNSDQYRFFNFFVRAFTMYVHICVL